MSCADRFSSNIWQELFDKMVVLMLSEIGRNRNNLITDSQI